MKCFIQFHVINEGNVGTEKCNDWGQSDLDQIFSRLKKNQDLNKDSLTLGNRLIHRIFAPYYQNMLDKEGNDREIKCLINRINQIVLFHNSLGVFNRILKKDFKNGG